MVVAKANKALLRHLLHKAVVAGNVFGHSVHDLKISARLAVWQVDPTL